MKSNFQKLEKKKNTILSKILNHKNCRSDVEETRGPLEVLREDDVKNMETKVEILWISSK